MLEVAIWASGWHEPPKSLLENFESTDVFEQAASGECCSSCDISSPRNFNCKESATLLLKAMREVVKLSVIKSGISQDEIISWLRGSKQGWIASTDIQKYLDCSESYSKGAQLDGRPLKKQWRSTHLGQLVHLGLIKISFNIYRGQTFKTASRSYCVTEKGHAFLESPYDLFVLHPDVSEDTKPKLAVNRKDDSTCRGKHHSPKIREQLSDCKRWFGVKEKAAYEYPSFDDEHGLIGYCKDVKKTEGFGSCQRPHFMWDDCQLTKRGTSTQKLYLKIDARKTEVWLKRAFCEGVKMC